MNVIDMFDIEKNSGDYINENSNWSMISHYFMFLTLKNGGCNKSSSGSIRLIFPTHWDDNTQLSAELGGYDMPNMSRHEEFSAQNEEDLKKAIIVKLEAARYMIVNCNDEESF